MSKINDDISTKVNKRLAELAEEIGTMDLDLKERDVDKFCSIIGDNIDLYNDELLGRLIPPSYIMNITNIVFQAFFIKFGPDLFKYLSAVIHVGSDVEIFRLMPVNKKYGVKFEYNDPTDISGKRGTYISVVFVLSILDSQNSVYAIDNHEFFLKVR